MTVDYEHNHRHAVCEVAALRSVWALAWHNVSRLGNRLDWIVGVCRGLRRNAQYSACEKE